MGNPIGASHYDVRVHLRLSVVERDVANERKCNGPRFSPA